MMVHLANGILIIIFGSLLAMAGFSAIELWRDSVEGRARWLFGFSYFALWIFWGWVCYSQGSGYP
jgi:hypothetical protein